MTYPETLHFLYNELPMFEKQGALGYKPGLERVHTLLDCCGNPHLKLKCIHVAGTNGKGSTSHMLASILQTAGYKVGLFTSPHLVDFRERIRVNGSMVPKEVVASFVTNLLAQLPKELSPSFFEYTTAMAFSYFAQQEVDFAVIEVGMGGRLDSTNVITPMVSVITNISIDHAQYLGNTLHAIANEKAGIIKLNTPVVLGRSKEKEVVSVMREKAEENNAELILADNQGEITNHSASVNGGWLLQTLHWGELHQPLGGEFQLENTATVLAVCRVLQQQGIPLTPSQIALGLKNIAQTGLHGRWELLRKKSPTIVADTGHNPGAWIYLGKRLEELCPNGLVAVLGFAQDKDISNVLQYLPKNARYIMTQAASPRAIPALSLAEMAWEKGLEAVAEPAPQKALLLALTMAKKELAATVFIGGSNYLLGDLLSCYTIEELSQLS